MAHDIKLDDIAERIIDAVLNEPILNRENLHNLIRPILKIWLKGTDSFRRQKAPKSKLQITIEQRDIEKRFWHNKLKDFIGRENIQKYYDELNDILIKEGYKKP